MLTPKTKKQSIWIWVCAVVLALLLSFCSALAQELSGTDPINWRMIFLAVVNTIVALVPVVSTGLGLPQFGKEKYISINPEALLDDGYLDYDKLAGLIIGKLHAKEQVQPETIQSSSSISRT